MATRVRFWIWWKGSPVKLTIVGDCEIEMGHSEPTEEGFAAWYEKYWVEDGCVHNETLDQGRDCDGYIENHAHWRAPLDQLRACPGIEDGDGLAFPQWERVTDSIYDQEAQKAGY
jgi:hypothetical protein